jgi:hypothetical protein
VRRIRPSNAIILAALFAGSAVLLAGQTPVESAWAGQPVVVDGLRQDWEGVPLTDWKKGAVSYAFRNDGESLYVLLVIQDPRYRSSIEATGVTLRFGVPGDKTGDHGILFKKLRLDPESYVAYLEKRGPVSEEDRAEIRRKAGFYLFHHQILDRKGNPVEAAGGAAGRPAVFKSAVEGQVLVHEFSVPLRRASDLAAGAGAEPGGALSVGFAWGGETEEQRKAAAKRLREQANFTNEEADKDVNPAIVPSAGSGPIPKKYSFRTSVKLAAPAR